MTGFFRLEFVGVADTGAGAIALVNGTIAGIDVGGGVYRGQYRIDGGRLKGQVELTFPAGGQLVSGRPVPPNAGIPISLDLPEDALDGHTFTVGVIGDQVTARLSKVADL